MSAEDDPTVRVDPRQAQQRYAHEVAAALADLPTDEAAEMRADLDGHLDDVGAELGAAPTYDQLVARLGPPARYAAELRSAAGFAAPAAGAGPGAGARVMTWWLRIVAVGAVLGGLVGGLSLLEGSPALLVFAAGCVAVVLAVTAVIAAVVLRTAPWDPAFTVDVRELPDAVRIRAAYGRARERVVAGAVLRYVASLRPAWWLVRAGVVAWLVDDWFGHAPLVLLAVLIVAAPISVWIGYRNRVDAGWNALTVPGNLLTLLLLVGLVL